MSTRPSIADKLAELRSAVLQHLAGVDSLMTPPLAAGWGPKLAALCNNLSAAEKEAAHD